LSIKKIPEEGFILAVLNGFPPLTEYINLMQELIEYSVSSTCNTE